MAFEQTMRNMRNIFFFKRRPKLHIPLEFDHILDTEAYHQALDYEGFVSTHHWKAHDLEKYPTVYQDIRDLEEHLLPAFFEFNQKALHFQNRFYLYQWVFMAGAFLTTFSGALTTYFYTLDGSMQDTLTTFMGFVTAGISGLTAAVTVLNDQSSPQRRWAKSRRLAEELRMTYYRYLAHLPPFDRSNRNQELRSHVVGVRRKENQDG
ncbi:MAG: DUF4231 domain-containing protein [Anaerolineales bacterium]